jgi:hypothetical protein
MFEEMIMEEVFLAGRNQMPVFRPENSVRRGSAFSRQRMPSEKSRRFFRVHLRKQ